MYIIYINTCINNLYIYVNKYVYMYIYIYTDMFMFEKTFNAPLLRKHVQESFRGSRPLAVFAANYAQAFFYSTTYTLCKPQA